VPRIKTVQVVAMSAVLGAVVAAGAAAAAGPWDGGQRTAERAYAASRDADASSARVAGTPAAPCGAASPGPGTPAAAPAAAAGGAHAPGADAGNAGGGGGNAGVVLALGAGGCGGRDGDGGRAPVAGPVLIAAGAGRAPAELAGKLAARLAGPMGSGDLGSVRTGAVVDVASGQVLYDHRSGQASAPASTTKLATAVAALGVLGDAYTLTTSVVATADHRIVLVGGGDPTLTLDGLATDTAAALHARGETSVRLGYDTSYYSGPDLHPIGVNENLARVTALMAGEGRLDGSTSGPAARAADPAHSAVQAFAAKLRAHGIGVTGGFEETSGAGGTRLAVHYSAPLADLVVRMLTNSDNDIAEALARQVARASGRPASFAGAAKAIPEALRKYGVPLGHSVFTDGSGLNRADALSPAALTRILALAASASHPELRPVVDGLPVAAFTGTLAARFHATPGAGVVRAKTGTLTGTNTIAGLTVTREGRVLAFSFMTQGAASTPGAEAALDALASAVAG
jgi:D-alanyl-D-alanine carboxypeptidase/D-alanyl-D-alanine-endopeptidase (penicillin-binding protein 4)